MFFFLYYLSLCCLPRDWMYIHIYIIYISIIYITIMYIYFYFFYTLFHHVLPQEIGYSSLCYTVEPHFLFIRIVIVCIYQHQTICHSLFFPPPPWQPQFCSLCPWICFWSVDRNISSFSQNETRLSTFTTVLQHSFGSPGHGSQRRKVNKRNPNWKRRSKTITVCRWCDTTPRKS